MGQPRQLKPRLAVVGPLLSLLCAAMILGALPFTVFAREGGPAPQDEETSAGALAASDPPRWAREAIGYHLQLRSFADSNGDGIGDFRGATQKLGYIRGLGVNTILLSPPMDNAGPNDYYGGYATTNLRGADADYGPLHGGVGSGSFEELITVAHQLGLRVLIDVPMDTAGRDHPAFQHSVVVGEASPFWPLFVWTAPDALGECSPTPTRFVGDPTVSMWVKATVGTATTPKPMCYWAPWADDVPEWNYSKALTVYYIKDTLLWWVNTMKVDGFRFDSVEALVDEDLVQRRTGSPETMAVLQEINSALKANNPQTYVFGELLAADQMVVDPFYTEGGIQAMTAYAVHGAIGQALDSETKTALLDAAQTQYDHQGVDVQLFIDNHDMWAKFTEMRYPSSIRSWDRFPNRADATDAERVRSQIVLAALLFSLPGTPFVYYGEEMGQATALACSYCERVEWSRAPMQWVSPNVTPNNGWGAAPGPWTPMGRRPDVWALGTGADRHGLAGAFAALAAIRQLSPSLQQGGFYPVATPDPNVLAFFRWYDWTLPWYVAGSPVDYSLVFVNLSSTASTAPGADLCALGIGSAGVTNRIWTATTEEQVTSATARAFHSSVLAPGEVKWLNLTNPSTTAECPRG